MDSLNALFDNDTARFAQKALDYLDDKQLQHVIAILDHPHEGRKQWRDKGLKPLYRNITKNIISKSALLYKDGLPTMEVMNNDIVDDRLTALFNDMLDDEMFVEFMTNFDIVLRLLKTALILTQYDDFDATLKMSILHRGNSVVKIDPFSKRVFQLIMKTGSDDEAHYFRIITQDYIEDWAEKTIAGSKAFLVNQEDNPYGVVPVSTFYDVALPRTGYWVEAPKDLVTFNDALNIHLVDTEYAASWAVHQTLFTNCMISGQDEDGEIHPDTVIGGLGKVVVLDTTGVDSPFVEYKGPVVDLTSSQALYTQWTKDIANDWSVTIKQDGLATQNVSGFSLIVQEKDNLELRHTRARMQESGLKRFFKTFAQVYDKHNTPTFGETELQVTFAKPTLPFDEEKSERIWSERIASGKASIPDYLMEKHKITREEAVEMWGIIRADNFENDIIG